MTSLETAAIMAQMFAAITAAGLVRRRPAHKPAAIALALLAIGAMVDGPIADALTPAHVEPWQGWHRVLVYMDGALNLSTCATIMGLAIVLAVAPEQRRRAVFIVGWAWLCASVVLGALYPSPLVRGESLQGIYLEADLLSMFVAIVALVKWARAGIAARRSPESVHAVAIGLVLTDLAILVTAFSPWRGSIIGASFEGIQLLLAIQFGTLAVAQVILWRFKSSTGPRRPGAAPVAAEDHGGARGRRGRPPLLRRAVLPRGRGDQRVHVYLRTVRARRGVAPRGATRSDGARIARSLMRDAPRPPRGPLPIRHAPRPASPPPRRPRRASGA